MYSSSLLYMPRPTLSGLPSASSLNLSLHRLSKSLDRWRLTWVWGEHRSDATEGLQGERAARVPWWSSASFFCGEETPPSLTTVTRTSGGQGKPLPGRTEKARPGPRVQRQCGSPKASSP